MTDQVGPSKPQAPEDSGLEQDLVLDHGPNRATDIVPIGPNLIATIVGFVLLMVTPSVCLHILAALWEDAIGEDRVASVFILASWEETFAIAGVGALLFLVLGIILQAWQARRPFGSRWPAILALPIAWALVVPETMLRGGSAASGAVVATAVALVFAVQWGSLVILRETMD